MQKGRKLTKEDMARGGRNSKRKPFDERFKSFLDKANKGKTNEDNLMQALYDFGMEGNVKAITELLDRAHGKPKQPIQQDITLDSEITVTFEPVEKKK